MSVEAQFTQNGFLYSRFSQESRFLVKELVKENDYKVNEDPGKPVFPGPSWLNPSFEINLLSIEAADTGAAGKRY